VYRALKAKTEELRQRNLQIQTLVQEKAALELEKDEAELGVGLDIEDEIEELDAILTARETIVR
jgi:hypothetical protein